MTEAREAARAAAWEAAKALVEEQTNGCVTERIDMAADALLAFAAAQGDDRESLAQEIRQGLTARGLWTPDRPSDLISATFKAIDAATARERGLREALTKIMAGDDILDGWSCESEWHRAQHFDESWCSDCYCGWWDINEGLDSITPEAITTATARAALEQSARGAAPEGPLVVRAEPIEPAWPKEMRAAPAETGETT